MGIDELSMPRHTCDFRDKNPMTILTPPCRAGYNAAWEP
jgi:hypothetical protein